MELLFIWVDDFHNIKKQGYNFSSKYFFDVALSSSELNEIQTITIKKNPNYIPNFFSKPNVRNVTSIIGKNGAGKSTILEYIRTYFPKGVNATAKNVLIAFTIFDADNSETNVLLYPKKWKIKFNGDTESFKLDQYDDFEGTIDNLFQFKYPSNADYIYYAYNLDQKPEIFGWDGLLNISTSAILQQIKKEINEFRFFRESDLQNNDSVTSDFELYLSTELAKTIQFLISEDRKQIDLPFTLPDTLYITIDNTDRKFFSKKDQKDEKVLNLISKLDKLQSSAKKKEAPLNAFYTSTIINFLLTDIKYSSIHGFDYSLEIGADENIKEFAFRFFSTLNTITYSGHEIESLIKASQLVPKFFLNVEKLLEDKILVQDHDNYQQFSFKFKLDNERLFQFFTNFMGLYLQIKGFTTFLEFRWRGLSTGEQSFLSLVSRFHHLKRHQIGNDQLEKNLVIMIDEGDIGYHPEWQRKFFKTNLDFLSSLFRDHKIQLIFAANAPFSTSDMPKSNVIFIEKNSASHSIVHKMNNDRQDTFGCNIHELFSDSFYMDGALIGEFAKEKIEDCIKWLNDKKDKTNIDYYKSLITIIGEPIIKVKLSEMLAEKLGEDAELARLRIQQEYINKRMKEIVGNDSNKFNV